MRKGHNSNSSFTWLYWLLMQFSLDSSLCSAEVLMTQTLYAIFPASVMNGLTMELFIKRQLKFNRNILSAQQNTLYSTIIRKRIHWKNVRLSTKWLQFCNKNWRLVQNAYFGSRARLLQSLELFISEVDLYQLFASFSTQNGCIFKRNRIQHRTTNQNSMFQLLGFRKFVEVG